jgi:hypothetical protein
MVLLHARADGGNRWVRSAKLRTDARGRVVVKRTLRRLTDYRLEYRGSPLMTAANSRIARVYVERPPRGAHSSRD